ncbi:MAG: mechanosensitive ion channel protein MscS [Nitrospira sp. LK265]|nr:mechanosensitive ion channel [Nitrospira sp.]NGZ59396.1 mechanosensitive ion channel protein MscS [Nitrospira sp. LK265]
MTVVDTLTQYAVQYGLQAAVAIGIFIAGVMASRGAGNFAQQALERQNLDPPVRLLLVRVVKVVVILFTAMIALQTLGVPIAPLIAGVGVAGVGIGLALQGVLSNVMAGLSIIFSKPYKVGEHISLLGVHGDVVVIDLFTTTLMHADRSRVIIPNRKIVGEILHNFGTIRQMHLTVPVSPNANLDLALAQVRDVLNRHPSVMKDPVPSVGVASLGDSSLAVAIAIEPWTAVVDYSSTQGDLNKLILQRFQEQGIALPSASLTVRMVNDHQPPKPSMS